MHITDWALFTPEEGESESEKVIIAVEGVLQSSINYALAIVPEMGIGLPGWSILIEAYENQDMDGIPFSEYLLPDVPKGVIKEVREFGLILRDYSTATVITFEPAIEIA